jgi:S-formylglutathione hydrolase
MLGGWSRTSIVGKPLDVFDPGSPTSSGVVIWLHDEQGESPATDPFVTAELQQRRIRCVAPLTQSSWWVDRINPEFDPTLTAERHLLDNLVPWLRVQNWLGSRPLALAGVGMGGQGALRLGFRYPNLFRVVASLDGALDFHERYGQATPLDRMYPHREAVRQDTAILQIDSLNWPAHIWFACSLTSPWYRGNDRLLEKLRAYGIPHTAHVDAVFETNAYLASMLEFVIGSVNRESRRLL